MTARLYPIQQRHTRPTIRLFPRTDWRGLLACAAYAWTYYRRGARRG